SCLFVVDVFFYIIFVFFFFFTYPATTEIYTLSLHDALPICLFELLVCVTEPGRFSRSAGGVGLWEKKQNYGLSAIIFKRDSFTEIEEHTSELQSRFDLVCRLLLEKKKHMVT